MYSYLLVDGIYPEWTCFLGPISHPKTASEKHYTTIQESRRKDIERAFGALLRDRFPLTVQGVTALVIAMFTLRTFGYGRMDLVVFALAVCALAIVLFSTVIVDGVGERRGAGLGGNGATDGGADGGAASISSTSSLMIFFLIPLILRCLYLLVPPLPLHSPGPPAK